MLARKPSALLAACNCLHSLPQSSTSSTPRRRRGTRQRTCALPTDNRRYATIAGDAREPLHPSERSEPPPKWPQAPKGHANPTPYQILDTTQATAYSKAHYYRLVKHYHPDRKVSDNHGLSDKIKMERYRLIVAAHSILSDPVKRSAYDRFGAGWNGKAELGSPEAWRQSSSATGPFSQNSWHDPNDPIWQNATWEDWERFRERQQQRGGAHPAKGAPVYMANSYFLAMIVALAMIGSSMNYGRAQDAGHYIVEQRDIVHDRAAKELRRVRMEASTLDSKGGRIDYFIRQREATLGAGDYEGLRDERAARVLRDREVCSSEQVRESGG